MSKTRTKLHRFCPSVEMLENREMMSVSSIWFNGSTLCVKTDNLATSVTVGTSASNIVIKEVGTSNSWEYSSSTVGRVEFQGGAGNDRFVNYVVSLPISAFGNGGDDYLEGYGGADSLVGGDGNDTMVGYGGNDMMWGGLGDDVLNGMEGDDQLMGEGGNDKMQGEGGNDMMWGGLGNDVLRGMDGADQLMGDDGHDRLNGGNGADKFWGGNGDDVLIAIDNGTSDTVQGDAGADIVWIDQTGSAKDTLPGTESSDKVQYVASFANGADRTLDGDNIVDPIALSGHTYKRFSGNPLFSYSGPVLNDIHQGSLGDCWLLAGLGAIADDNPLVLRRNIVDFDDGTYGVRLGSSFYRVDADLPVASSTSTTPVYQRLGVQNSMWAAVAEKAYAHYRTGANTYASLVGGWSVEVNKAFGAASTGDKAISSYSSATAMANALASLCESFSSVTVGFSGGSIASGAPLVNNHMYTVAWVTRDSAGVVTSITLRNPWGSDGGGSTDGNTSDGYVIVTPAQLFGSAGRINWGHV